MQYFNQAQQVCGKNKFILGERKLANTHISCKFLCSNLKQLLVTH